MANKVHIGIIGMSFFISQSWVSANCGAFRALALAIAKSESLPKEVVRRKCEFGKRFVRVGNVPAASRRTRYQRDYRFCCGSPSPAQFGSAFSPAAQAFEDRPCDGFNVLRQDSELLSFQELSLERKRRFWRCLMGARLVCWGVRFTV